MSFLGYSENDTHIIITILGIKIKIRSFYSYPFAKLFCYLVSKFAKVKNNKIVFINMMDGKYNCNLKYIHQELEKRLECKNLDLVWVQTTKLKKGDIPEGFRITKYTSLKCLYELMTAKAWISNAHMILAYKKGLQKNKNTIHFHTHHGSMGIKKLDGDAAHVYGQKLNMLNWQKISSSTMDYLFLDSQKEKEILNSALMGYPEILLIGKARDSIFFQDPKPYIDKVKEFYNIPSENKIFLYAPTWRDDKRCFVYNIDINLLKKSLKTRFGGEWTILIRAHSRMKKDAFNSLYDRREVINCGQYTDMQELLAAADILMSDYSSCLPEFTILKKPSFIYCSDYKEFLEKSNGFYYPLETLPAPIAKDNYELAENILNFDEKKFLYDVEAYLQKMGHNDDENSCIRIVDFILEKIK